ncbi:hypothetical protein R6Q59_035671 [Mikania micrantha]
MATTDSGFLDTEDDADTSHQTSEPTPDPTTHDPSYDPTFEPTPDTTSDPAREPTPDSNPSKEGPTVAECYEKLKLVGLDPVDPLFLAAFHIFGVSTGMREAWMTLPDIPDVLRGWIVMTATSLGLIKA